MVDGARVEQAQAMAGHSDLRATTRYAHTAQQLQATASGSIGWSCECPTPRFTPATLAGVPVFSGYGRDCSDFNE